MDASLAHLMGWTETTKGDVPPPLTGPSITVSPLPLPHPPTVFLFGGKYVQNRRLTNEMWAMDLSTRIWERIDAGRGPGPRYFHSMNVWEDKLVCFGGMSDTDPMSVHDDIWFFDCATRRWLPPPTPAPGLVQDEGLLPMARYAHLSAVSRGQLVVFGGQHSDNSWIYEVNVFDLRQKVWVSKTAQPELQGQHSKGAYRSVATSSKSHVIIPTKPGDPSAAHSFSLDEEGEGGDIWCYSNYDFAKVRRELDLIAPLSSSDIESPPSEKYHSPPSFAMQDQSGRMRGSSQPPGLRFPAGGIVGNHFILCGLYLASSSAAFSIWALNLDTMAWKHIEPAVLNSGSWNRAVVWPEAAKVLIFGNTSYNLTDDYGRRAVNLDHVAVISLETYGIYCPPRLEIPAKTQELGLTMLGEKLASDFEVVSNDGRKIRCSRKVLSERWPWFAQQEAELRKTTAGILRENSTIDISDTLLGSFTPARLAPTCLNIPEPFPVCVALLQYFYTLNLSTPLQNRASILSALLFIAKHYKIERLAKIVVHALHERLEPNVAVGIYEIATLSGEQELQVRALQMIHAAKTASSSRSNRQGLNGAVVQGENMTSPQATSPPQTFPAPSDSAPASTGPSGRSASGDTNFRQARAESPTLPDIDLDAVHSLIATLTTDDNPETEIEEHVGKAEPTSPDTVSEDIASMTGPPPLSQYPSFPNSPDLDHVDFASRRRPSSPTSSESTSLYPLTPRESLRPPYGSIGSRSSSSSPHPGSDESHQSYFILHPEHHHFPRADKQSTNTSSIGRQAAPPSALSSRQAQAINALQQYVIDGDRSLRRPSATDSLRSIDSTSQQSESHISLAPSSEYAKQRGDQAILRQLSLHSELGGRSDSSSSISPSHRALGIDILSSSVSSFDVSSISSGSTSDSSRKTLKADRKAIAAAEKATRKAEARAKFEASRAEQLRKQNLARAEAQRKLEVAKAEKAQQPTAPPPQEKNSKLRKFGTKFTEAVLFPSGGEKSTMF